jgi:hypothetical protein
VVLAFDEVADQRQVSAIEPDTPITDLDGKASPIPSVQVCL